MYSLGIGAAIYIVSYGNPYGFWCGNVHCFLWKSVWVFGVALYIVSYIVFVLTKKIIGSTF